MRALTVSRKKAGLFTIRLSLKNVAPHKYTLRVTAKDAQGLQSLAATRSLRVVR